MKESLKTIFGTQIKKFKALKEQYNNIEREKMDFNYDDKLSKIQNNMQNSIEEINNSKNLSDEIKRSTIQSIELEFKRKKEELDAQIKEFGEEFGWIDLQRSELRNDPKYIEAMIMRRKLIQSEKRAKQLKQDKHKANTDYNRSKDAYEQAKLVMEQKKKEVDEANTILTNSEDAYNKSLEEKDEQYKSYTKEIERVLTMDDIKNRINSAIQYFVKNPITIDVSELQNKSLLDILRFKIYRKSGLSTQGCTINRIDDNIVLIDDTNISKEIEAGDIFNIYCCYGDEESGEIEVKIVGENSDKGDSNDEGNGLDTTLQTAPENKFEDIEILQDIEGVKDYFVNLNIDEDNYFLSTMKQAASEKDLSNSEFYIVLKNIAIIYKLYDHKKEVLNLIVYLSRLLAHSKILEFIEYARDKAIGHGKIDRDLYKAYQTIILLINDNESLKGKERKESELGIVSCICSVFGLNIEKDIKISDITSTGMLRGGMCKGA